MKFEGLRKFVPIPRATKKKEERTIDIPPMRLTPEIAPVVEMPTGGEIVLFERISPNKVQDAAPVITRAVEIPTPRPTEKTRPAKNIDSTPTISPWHDALQELVSKKNKMRPYGLNAPAFVPPTYRIPSTEETTTALTNLEKVVTTLRQQEPKPALTPNPAYALAA